MTVGPERDDRLALNRMHRLARVQRGERLSLVDPVDDKTQQRSGHLLSRRVLGSFIADADEPRKAGLGHEPIVSAQRDPMRCLPGTTRARWAHAQDRLCEDRKST